MLAESTKTAGIGRKRAAWRRLLVAVPVVTAVIAAVAVAEMVLRHRALSIRASDHLEAGMTVYDPRLGWVLAPYWHGAHSNCDFAVEYRTNGQGFRNDSPDPAELHRPYTAVFGDSFTFGFGVGDDQTFVARLNAATDGPEVFVNYGVPGYSTDQQVLLCERVLEKWRPSSVLLIVYLGNDLLDNPLAYPLQVELPKPLFVLQNGDLVLSNTPVPRTRKQGRDPGLALREAVLGEETGESLASKSALLSALSERLGPPRRHTDFSLRLADEVQLFARLVERLESDCRRCGAELTLVLLGGRSTIEKPESLSGQYQEYFRSAVADWAAHAQLRVVDVVLRMRREFDDQRWYFPHDGHLTPQGHGYVADVLIEEQNAAKEEGLRRPGLASRR